MRCQAKIKKYFVREVMITEYNDSGNLETFFTETITWKKVQCQVTTRQKSGNCWKILGMCGKHAAEYNPLFYPKSKGHKTGGRLGFNKSDASAISMVN